MRRFAWMVIWGFTWIFWVINISEWNMLNISGNICKIKYVIFWCQILRDNMPNWSSKLGDNVFTIEIE